MMASKEGLKPRDRYSVSFFFFLLLISRLWAKSYYCRAIAGSWFFLLVPMLKVTVHCELSSSSTDSPVGDTPVFFEENREHHSGDVGQERN